MKNPTKLLILVEMLDLLTTMIGISFLGLQEMNPLLFGWGLKNLILIKLLCVCFMITLMEQCNYGWLAWIPSVIASLPVFGNLYVIASLML